MFRMLEFTVTNRTEHRDIGRLDGRMSRRVFGNPNLEIGIKGFVEPSVFELLQLMASDNTGGMQPISINLDERGRLHSETDPSVIFVNGKKSYHIHGVSVPPKIVENPRGITKEEFLRIKNAEVRRVLIQQIGTDKFVKLLDLEVEDIKMINNEEVTLLKTRRKDDIIRDYLKFIRVIDTSTGNIYYLSVPPNLEDAHEAVAWTFGKKKNEYNPEIET